MKINDKKTSKDAMSEGEIAEAFRAFGFVHRGGSRPRPLNMRFCDRLCNKDFAAQDANFRNKCAAAGAEPTRRQASKWRNKKGKAYRYSQGLDD